METSYFLPGDETVTHEWEIKHSKFITHITRVTDGDTARAFVDSIKRSYPDASHNCSAWIHHVDGANPVERSSDDGEPSGTAGTPMLDQLKGSGMLDIAAVVTRYYGGVKLGAGGLVHAYSNSVSQCLEQVRRLRRQKMQLATVSLPHADAGRIEAELRHAGITITHIEYASHAVYTIAFEPPQRERVDAVLAAATAGSAEALEAGYDWVEADASS